MTDKWWREAVFYQIYPLSFADSNGDGYGDLEGIRGRLDYLGWLGVDAVWISPFYRSPMEDWGYDVSDHTDVDPLFGDLEAFDTLLEQAHARGLRVILDLVLNHTSDAHPWFAASRSSRDDPRRDWYVWERTETPGLPPNNWVSVFGGPAWTWDETTGEWYRHTYLSSQPDLNWRNPDVVEEMMSVIRFWLDRGVDGFRVDAAHQIMKDPLNRDNPPTPPGYVDPYKEMGEYGRWIHIWDRGNEDVHGIHRQIRKLTEEYDRAIVTIGEIHEFEPTRWLAYYGSDDELDMPFNYQLMVADWSARAVREVVEVVEETVPEWAWTNWTMGNHDEVRVASRLGDAGARQAAVLVMTLRGTPFLYYGDELGMLNGSNQGMDPWGDNTAFLSRDGCRTPMQWRPGDGLGFTTGTPWIDPGPEHDLRSVEVETGDPGSFLAMYRSLLALRKARPSLRSGEIAFLPAPGPDVLIYSRTSRQERTVIAVNFGADSVGVDGPGDVVFSVGEHEQRGCSLVLGPRSAVIWDEPRPGVGDDRAD